MNETATQIQVTERQLVTLCGFLLASVKPANRDERRRYARTFREFKILPIKDKILDNKLMVVDVTDKPRIIEISGDPMDYLLEKLNQQTDGAASFSILELEEILLRVKDGSYALPTTQLASVPIDPAQTPQAG